MGTLDQAAAAAGAPASAQSPAPAAAAPEQTQTAPVQQQRPTQPTAAKKPAGGAGVPEEPATPEEQQEFDRVMQAVATVLYSNEETSNAIVDQILPDDKVGSTAKASMLFIKQLDEKVGMDEIVVAEVTQESVTRIMELAEARHSFEYTPQEAEQILGATWEGVSSMFGVDESQLNELVNKVGADSLPAYKEQYEAALNG